MCSQTGIISVDSSAASLSGHRCLFRAFLNDRKAHGLRRDAGLEASGRRSQCDCCSARGHRLRRRTHRYQRLFTVPRYIISGLADIATGIAHEEIDVTEMRFNRDVEALYAEPTHDISAF